MAVVKVSALSDTWGVRVDIREGNSQLNSTTEIVHALLTITLVTKRGTMPRSQVSAGMHVVYGKVMVAESARTQTTVDAGTM